MNLSDLKSRGFPLDELDRIAREGSFEEVVELNHATGLLYKPLRLRLDHEMKAKRKALEEAART